MQVCCTFLSSVRLTHGPDKSFFFFFLWHQAIIAFYNADSWVMAFTGTYLDKISVCTVRDVSQKIQLNVVIVKLTFCQDLNELMALFTQMLQEQMSVHQYETHKITLIHTSLRLAQSGPPMAYRVALKWGFFQGAYWFTTGSALGRVILNEVQMSINVEYGWVVVVRPPLGTTVSRVIFGSQISTNVVMPHPDDALQRSSDVSQLSQYDEQIPFSFGIRLFSLRLFFTTSHCQGMKSYWFWYRE